MNHLRFYVQVTCTETCTWLLAALTRKPAVRAVSSPAPAGTGNQFNARRDVATSPSEMSFLLSCLRLLSLVVPTICQYHRCSKMRGCANCLRVGSKLTRLQDPDQQISAVQNMPQKMCRVVSAAIQPRGREAGWTITRISEPSARHHTMLFLKRQALRPN